MTTNIVDCPVERLSIGMPLQVVFEQQGEHFIPLFEPDRFGHTPYNWTRAKGSTGAA